MVNPLAIYTVAKLRKFLLDLPDDMKVHIGYESINRPVIRATVEFDNPTDIKVVILEGDD